MIVRSGLVGQNDRSRFLAIWKDSAKTKAVVDWGLVNERESSQITYFSYYGYRIRLTTTYVNASRCETLKADANADL